MVDMPISSLDPANSINNEDLFVLEQGGVAKKLSGNTLKNLLLAMADGHGGIASIDKTASSGVDPVVDTYTITYADDTISTFSVTNGLKGDASYVHIRYASNEPTQDSDISINPNSWIGFAVTTSPNAPTSHTAYAWYQIKGEKGEKGDNITVASQSVSYQISNSGTTVPDGTWLNTVPSCPQGKYLWTRTIVNYSDGAQTISYSVSRMGIDGTGTVVSVNNQSPDGNGNVTISASDVGALPSSYTPPVASVNGKTGTVTLDADDVEAVPQAGSNGFLYRSSDNVSEKEFKKTLWTGSWSTGNITVPGITDYSLFIVKMYDQGTNIIASLKGTYFRGMGGYAVSSSNELNYYINATRSGDTLTMVHCHSFNTNGRIEHTVTEIIGII